MSTRVVVLVIVSAVSIALGLVLSCTKETPVAPSFTNPLDERNTDTRMQIKSIPDSARIIIDGRDTGAVTPHMFVPFQPGTVSVILKKDFYRDFGPENVVIREGRLNDVSAVLYRGIGGLAVNSVPSGASIELDGLATGYDTPHDFGDILAGVHTVTLRKRFYVQWGPELVTVSDGVTNTISVDLAVGTGSLVVESEPSGCSVLLDGHSEHGWVTPYTFYSLQAGWHTVHIEAPSIYRADTTFTIAVEVDQTNEISVALRERTPHADVVMFGEPNIIPYGYNRDAKVLGQVRNQGEIAAHFTKIFITFYDGLDFIIGTEDCYVDDTDLEPGEQCTFECRAYGVPYDYVGYYTWTFSWSEY